MATHTITTTDEQEQALTWAAQEQGVTVDALVQSLADDRIAPVVVQFKSIVAQDPENIRSFITAASPEALAEIRDLLGPTVLAKVVEILAPKEQA